MAVTSENVAAYQEARLAAFDQLGAALGIAPGAQADTKTPPIKDLNAYAARRGELARGPHWSITPPVTTPATAPDGKTAPPIQHTAAVTTPTIRAPYKPPI
jgi:hypothetical protein